MQHAQLLIEAQDLHKHYGQTPAVRGVSFQIKRGEIVGFLGPNGAGKSTTLKMLTGFLAPSAGRALIAGISVTDNPLGARRMLGYLPENAPLYHDMMVIDFLRFIAVLRGVHARHMASDIDTVLQRCGLTSVVAKDIGQLSKGFRQRVGIASTLLGEPSLLILDEPTNGLDPNQIIEIRALIRELGRDKTIFLSSHILSEVQATCNRMIIINDGSIVADGTPDTLSAANHDSLLIRVVLKHASKQQCLQCLQSIAGVQRVSIDDQSEDITAIVHTDPSYDVREAIFNTAVANNFVVIHMSKEHISLEETFQRLTKLRVAS